MIEAARLAAIAVLAGGALAALQGPTNGMLSQALRSPVNAALASFGVATVVLLGAALVVRTPPDLAAVRALPWYGWLGGVYGAVFVTASAYAVLRLGATTTVALFLVGQLSMAVLLDRMSAFGLPLRPIDPGRVLGLAMLVGGALLVRRV